MNSSLGQAVLHGGIDRRGRGGRRFLALRLRRGLFRFLYTVGLLYFHGKKAAFICQEIFARLILYNFTEVIANRAAVKKEDCKFAYCVRFGEAVFICRKLLRGQADPELVESTIARFVSPIRPGRSLPRKLNPKEPVFFVYRAA